MLINNHHSMPLLKLYGERNTGTNYLEELIRLNLHAETLRNIEPRLIEILQMPLPGKNFLVDLYFSLTNKNNLGWKHMLTLPAASYFPRTIDARPIHIITITKNPYSWLLSLYKRPHHYRGRLPSTFEEFLVTPWRTVERENSPRYFSSPVELWNQKNAAYLGLSQYFQVRNVRYEDFLVDYQAVLMSLMEAFSIGRINQSFLNVEQSTKNDPMRFDDYKRYYLGELWKNDLSTESIRLINDRLDRDIVKKYNYEII